MEYKGETLYKKCAWEYQQERYLERQVSNAVPYQHWGDDPWEYEDGLAEADRLREEFWGDDEEDEE